jgi:hypothetical protein
MANKHINDLRITIGELLIDLRDNVFYGDSQLQGDFTLVEFFFKKLNDTSLINYIVKHILPYERQILNHDLNFFITKKNDIFGGLPQNRVDYITNKVIKLPKDDTDVLWTYFDSILNSIKQYKKDT